MYRVTGFLLVSLSAICFGVMPILARIAYSSGTGTSTLLFLRFLVGGLFMLTLMKIKKLHLSNVKNIFFYIGMGALGYAGQSFCYFTALKYASASLVALLLYIYPAIVTLISVVFLHERINPLKIIAVILALSGCTLIVGFTGSGNIKGIILALAAALIYAVYIVCGSKIIKNGMAVQSSAVIMLSASFVFGLSLLNKGFEPPKNMNGLISIIAIALVSTVIAIWSFFSGLERIGPTNASLISTLEPVVTVACSIVFLGERLSMTNVIGGCLVFGALLAVAFSHKKTITNPSVGFRQERTKRKTLRF